MRVVVAGMGGLGWLIGGALIGLGVRHLELFDPDVLTIVNLNRLWGCSRDQIGAAKVDIFAQTARAVDCDIDIKTYAKAIPCIDFENALATADVVFGGFDQPEPRLATQLLALKTKTLYIDAGVAIQAGENGFFGFGQVFTSAKSTSGCIVCAGLRLDNIGYRGEREGPLPSSGVLNGVLANLAVSIWLQHLQGAQMPPLTLFNWSPLGLQPHTLQKRPNCSICGAYPAWAESMEQ